MLGTVHKRRPQSGDEGGCPVRTFCGQGGGGVLQIRTNIELSEIYGVSARTRGEKGVTPVRTFCGEGESIIRDFVRTSFMDGPLLVRTQAQFFLHLCMIK